MRFKLQLVGLGAAVAVALAIATAMFAGAAAASSGGAAVNVHTSDYGNVLVGPGGLVVYMYGPDRASKSRCYGTCARAWHPLLTKGKPVAGRGVTANLLGTTTRNDGNVQVTYNGHPLYFDNETGESHKPFEIGCQQFNVNGGIWLIMKPNGQPNRSPAKPHHE